MAESSGIIAGNTAVDDTTLLTLQTSLMTLELGELLALYLQSFLIGFTMKILGIAIFVIVYGRMVEIYLAVSLAPIPFSTFGSKEQSQIGQNYLRSLLALGLQGFLIMICVGIYAVLIQGVSFASDPIASIWGVIGYTACRLHPTPSPPFGASSGTLSCSVSPCSRPAPSPAASSTHIDTLHLL